MVIEPGVPARRHADRCRREFGPLTTLIDSPPRRLRIVYSSSHGADSTAATRRPVRLPRPTLPARQGKAGTFVEKELRVRRRHEGPHLSYLGDADIGAARIGAGAITANYDGANKHRTTIGARVRASFTPRSSRPVKLGDGSYTGAGSVITDDVPPDALGIARERQTNIEGSPSALLAKSGDDRRDVGTRATLRRAVSALDPHLLPATSLELAYGKRLMLFSGRANPEPAAKIGSKLGVDLGGVTLKTFADGEVYCRYQESIRGADVFIVQPTCGNPRLGMTPNDSLMELLLMIDAAVGASAHRVIAVTPWFGYSRQDKKSSPREPISARLVARALESAGADRVLTMDLHAGQIQGFFSKPSTT